MSAPSPPTPESPDDRFITITLDREAMRERGRIGGHVMHSRHDSHQIAARAREGLTRKFLDQVDPERTLPEAERQRRAAHARRAFMLRIALQGAQARQGKTADTSDTADRPAATAAKGAGEEEAGHGL
jgi:hypothetical protein